MKIKRTYIVLALLLAGIVLLAYLEPKKVSWTPTYDSKDKVPYGSYILYERLKDIFPGSEIDQPDRGFYTFEEASYDTVANYIIATDEMNADDLDVRRMTSYAYEGNNIFISAYTLPQMLADTLGIQLKNSIDVIPSDSGGYEANFADARLRTKGGYHFRHENLSFRIQNASRHKISELTDDTTEASSVVMRERIVLGKDGNDNVNFVKIPFGHGAFYIHTFPLAFTNYNMLKKDNNEYVSKCLSFLPNRRTHWDEYYKPFSNMKANTPLRFILSVPSYAWAYYIALSSLLLYMIFASKRTQRIIPILAPPANMSLEFTKTIGSLYYQQRDHRDIAVKKMIYLLEKLRQQYFLQTADTSETFRTRLAYRSNVSIDTINEVFNIYERDIRRVRYIDERTLISFNTALENFYAESGLINK